MGLTPKTPCTLQRTQRRLDVTFRFGEELTTLSELPLFTTGVSRCRGERVGSYERRPNPTNRRPGVDESHCPTGLVARHAILPESCLLNSNSGQSRLVIDPLELIECGRDWTYKS